MSISPKIKTALLNKFEGEEERVGFILADEKVVEVQNVCSEPKDGFDVAPEDLLLYVDDAVASWHTHPNNSSNLSVRDFETFLFYPHMRHYIVGVDGVSEFYVEDGEVLIAD